MYPLMLPKTNGIDDPNIATGMLLNIQNNPMAKMIPKVDRYIEYHISSGNNNPAGGVINESMKKFSFPSANIPGLPDPNHRPTMSGVWELNMVEPEELLGTMFVAVVVIYCCDLEK